MIKKVLFLSQITAIVIGTTGCITSVDNTSSTTENGDRKVYNSDISDISSEVDSSISKENRGNLDDSKAVITEYKPKSGVWKQLFYRIKTDLVDDVNKRLPAMVEGLGYTYDSSYGYYNIYDSINGLKIFYIDEDLPAEYSKIANYVVYNSDDIHLEYNIGGKIEIWFPTAAQNIIPHDESRWPWSVLFRDGGEDKGDYDLTDKSEILEKKYRVGTKEQSIGEAAKRVLSYIDSIGVSELKSTIFDYVNGRVTVKQFTDEQYGYLFTYDLNYDGVPIIDSCGYHDTRFVKENIDDYEYIKTVVPVCYLAGTYSDNGCDYFWTGPCAFYEPEISEIGDSIMSYADAKKIVSDFLSPNHTFDVDSAELQYAFIQEAETKVTESTINNGIYTSSVEPVWRFTISHLNTADRSLLYVNVIARTGEIMLEYI